MANNNFSNCLVTRLRAVVGETSLGKLEDGNYVTVKWYMFLIPNKGTLEAYFGPVNPVRIEILDTDLLGLTGVYSGRKDTIEGNYYVNNTTTYLAYLCGIMCPIQENNVNIINGNGNVVNVKIPRDLIENISCIDSPDFNFDWLETGEHIRFIRNYLYSTSVNGSNCKIFSKGDDFLLSLINLEYLSCPANGLNGVTISDICKIGGKDTLRNLIAYNNNISGNIEHLGVFKNITLININSGSINGSIETLVRNLMQNGRNLDTTGNNRIFFGGVNGMNITLGGNVLSTLLEHGAATPCGIRITSNENNSVNVQLFENNGSTDTYIGSSIEVNYNIG